MSAVSIRAATFEDASRFVQIHRRAILELGPASYTGRECDSWASGLQEDLYRKAMTSGGETFHVAEIDDHVIGFCSFREEEIIGLYVHPNHGRKGIGSALLASAESQISARPARVIRLNAALPAVEFYQFHGYRIIGRRSWKTRGGLSIGICRMVKDLSPPGWSGAGKRIE